MKDIAIELNYVVCSFYFCSFFSSVYVRPRYSVI